METLCRYADYLNSSLKSHNSVINYLSGVKTLHVLTRYDIQAFNDVAFRLTVRGFGRLNQYVPNEAPPITVEILQKMLLYLDLSNEDDLIFFGCMSSGFLFATTQM